MPAGPARRQGCRARQGPAIRPAHRQAPAPAPTDVPNLALAPAVVDAPDAVQDRRACCGTMNLPEYYNIEAILAQEINALAQWCAAHGRTGPAG